MHEATSETTYASLDALLAKPPVRLKDATQLRGIHTWLQQGDLAAATDRSIILQQLTGGLPFDPEALEEAGRADATNVNFGGAEDHVNNIVASYCNLVGQDEVIASPVLKPTVEGSPDDKREWEAALASEYTWINNEKWPNFFHYRMRLTRQFLFFGMGFAIYEEDRDWRWSPFGLEDVKVQRREKMSMTDFEMIVVKKSFTAPDLLKLLGKSASAAKEAGWDVDLVLEQLPYFGKHDNASRYLDPEFWVREVKNNDYLYRMADAKKLEVLMALYKNLDGTVGFALCTLSANGSSGNQTKDGKEKADFLFHNPRMYDCSTDFIVPFAYEIGTGDFGSIRGVGHKVYQKGLATDRAMCLLVDSCMNSSASEYQAKDERAIENFAVFRHGASSVIPPGFTYIERAVPNYAQNVMPVIQEMRLLNQDAVGPTQRGNIPSVQEQTATASKIAAATDAELNAAERTNFFTSLKWLYNSQWKRLTRKDLSIEDPGGMEAMEMRKRLLARGVPMKVILHGVDYWVPTRPIGNGSAAVAQIKLDKLTQLGMLMPPEGRAEALRWNVAEIVGWDKVQAFVPKIPATPSIEAQFAVIENTLLASGKQIPILPGQDDTAHIQMHAPMVHSILQDLAKQPPTPELLLALAHTAEHTGDHYDRLMAAPVPNKDLKPVAQLLAVAANAVKQVSALMQKMGENKAKQMQDAQGAQGGQPPQGMDPETQQKLAENQAFAQQKLQTNEALAKQKMELAQRKADQQQQNKQIGVAANLQHKDLVGAHQVELKNQQAAADRARKTGEAPLAQIPGVDGVELIKALSGAFKSGLPVTALQLNMALADAGLPPINIGPELPREEPIHAGTG